MTDMDCLSQDPSKWNFDDDNNNDNNDEEGSSTSTQLSTETSPFSTPTRRTNQQSISDYNQELMEEQDRISSEADYYYNDGCLTSIEEPCQLAEQHTVFQNAATPQPPINYVTVSNIQGNTPHYATPSRKKITKIQYQ